MDTTEYLTKLKRSFAGAVLIGSALFIVHRGNSVTANADFSMLVPIMCVMTALALTATGLAIILKNSVQTE